MTKGLLYDCQYAQRERKEEGELALWRLLSCLIRPFAERADLWGTTMSARDGRERDETRVTLYHGMLFRARGVFKRYVCNRAVTTYEVRTLAMYMKQIYATTTPNKSVVCQSEAQ